MIKVQAVDPTQRFLVDRIESAIARDYTTKRDENGNGVVDRSEFSGSDDLFEQIDRDEDSQLGLAEIKRYVDLLKQYEPTRDVEATAENAGAESDQTFSVSRHTELTESMKDFFSQEIASLDENDNGLLEADEFVGTLEEFSEMDADQDDLLSPSEWIEGFIDNETKIEMALEAYRYSRGIFETGGGIVQMTV
jgi:hypothetical protein